MTPRGQILEFRSDVDGALHPCAVCATDDTPEPKPLIIEVSPGAMNDLPGAVALTEEIAGIAAAHGRSCVVLRPTGRGPGSVYQNYGEVDVLEAIEFVASRYAIDRDRITITGASMGGAATWYLASHYPDLFAAAAPFCGYADYRLWEKPGGLTFQMREWEEPSWQARSAALLVENLEHTPVWIVHGEWDRAVGGGVSVEHSRQMAGLLEELRYPFIYTELPETGHDSRQPDVWERVILWLLDQRKVRDPDHVALATFTLRHRRSYWVAIEQLARYGERALVDAVLSEDGRLAVVTEQRPRNDAGAPCRGARPWTSRSTTPASAECTSMQPELSGEVHPGPGRQARPTVPARSGQGSRARSATCSSPAPSSSREPRARRPRRSSTNGSRAKLRASIEAATAACIAAGSWA